MISLLSLPSLQRACQRRAVSPEPATAQLREAFFFGTRSCPRHPEKGSVAPVDVVPYRGLTFQEARRQFQAALLRDALEANGWNVTETAAKLDLARSHAYKLVRAFDLSRR